MPDNKVEAEPVNKTGPVFTDRIPVPGGWLYRTHMPGDVHGKTISTSFVPDATANW